MFKSFDTFATLKQYGRWLRLDSIDFQDSHDNVMLQLSDAVTYVEAKATWLAETHRDKALVTQLRQRYLRRAYRPSPRPQGALRADGFFAAPSDAYAELMAMLTEMALLHCGSTPASLSERRARLEEVMSRYPDVLWIWPRP